MPYFAVVAKTFNFCFNHWTVILACNNSSSFKYHPVFTPDLNISHENWNDSTFYNLILTTLSGSSMEGAGEAVLSLLSTFWYLTSSSLNSLNSLTSLSCKAQSHRLYNMRVSLKYQMWLYILAHIIILIFIGIGNLCKEFLFENRKRKTFVVNQSYLLFIQLNKPLL